MPTPSFAQHRLMEGVAHSLEFAKKVGIPQQVGKEMVEKDDRCERYMDAVIRGDCDEIQRIFKG
jgi:hypothetical protein